VLVEVFLVLYAGAATVALVFVLILRQWRQPRSATREEVRATLPGDDLVPNPRTGYTQAITIHAPPGNVWPWLIQVGYRRAGWYTYDWFYKLIKSDEFVDGHSSNRIVPELQNLKVGDEIAIFAAGPFKVAVLEPNRTLVLLARVDFTTGKPFELADPMPGNFLNNSWVFVLEKVDANTTRLVVRYRMDYSPSMLNKLAYSIPTDGGALIFQPKMLQGIKERAEKQR
jgi:hypothetical protein